MNINLHISELQRSLIKCVIVLLFAMLITFYRAPEIIQWIKIPIEEFLPSDNNLVFTGVADKFVLLMKISFLGGFILASPYFLYQVAVFVMPALTVSERWVVMSSLMASWPLFITGIVFAYYGPLPSALKFLLLVGGDFASPMITIKEYLNFSIMLLLMSGLFFQIPLIFYLLVKWNIININFLIKRRGHIYLALAIMVALITPSVDVFGMLILLIPMYLLFELGVLILWIKERRKLCR